MIGYALRYTIRAEFFSAKIENRDRTTHIAIKRKLNIECRCLALDHDVAVRVIRLFVADGRFVDIVDWGAHES